MEDEDVWLRALNGPVAAAPIYSLQKLALAGIGEAFPNHWVFLLRCVADIIS